MGHIHWQQNHQLSCYPLLFHTQSYNIILYYVDEYEKLWAAATGGRGTGRGRKKKVQKGVAPEKLKYGRGEMKWEGFNAPVVLEGDKETKEKDEKEYEGFEKGRTSWFSRGWSGRTWPGRKTGHPERPNKGQ